MVCGRSMTSVLAGWEHFETVQLLLQGEINFSLVKFLFNFVTEQYDKCLDGMVHVETVHRYVNTATQNIETYSEPTDLILHIILWGKSRREILEKCLQTMPNKNHKNLTIVCVDDQLFCRFKVYRQNILLSFACENTSQAETKHSVTETQPIEVSLPPESDFQKL